MRRFTLCLLLLAPMLPAMGKRPGTDELYLRAVAQYQAGEFEEAGAVFKALAPESPLARQAWLAFLFERQGYGALELELSGTAQADERLLLARSRADGADWQGCLRALDGLGSREASILRAEALDSTGSSLAASAWDEALKLEQRNPAAAFAEFKAANFSERSGDLETAERRYKRAEKMDQAYSSVQRCLADIYFQSGRLSDAKTRLERALKVDANDLGSRDCLNLLLKSQPSLLADARLKDAKRERARLGQKNPRVIPMPRKDGEPLIRVGVLQNAQRFKFRAGSPTRLEPQGLTLSADTVYQVDMKAGHWRLTTADAGAASLVARFDLRPAILSPGDPASTLSVFDVEFGAGYFWAGKEDRSFRGNFEFSFRGQKSVDIVNELPLDAYLLGVIPSEMPQGWNPEALFAQAVAARGDTLGKKGRHKAQGFDLCSDVHCEMYRGVGEESPATTWAVTMTAGEVLEDGAKLLGGIYMNSCGGHTQDSWDTWTREPKTRGHAVLDGKRGPAFPLSPQDLLGYLEDAPGAVDAWCSRAPGEPYSEFRWVARYSREELEQTVNRRHAIGRLQAVEPLERSEAGYVRRVRFTGSKGASIGSSDYIRSSIKGLRSNLFYVETRRDADGEALEFLFHGGGWGHGVGFCQSGAAAMAAAGIKHADILRHYFKGGEIKRRY